MFDAAPYRTRRARILTALGEHAALVLAATPELRVGRDIELRYAPDADLYYLTGYTEPEAVLVLCPSHDEAPFTLFVRPRDPARELWTGVRGGVEAALERFGADAAYPIEELRDRLPAIVGHVDTLYARLDAGPAELIALVPALVAAGRRRRARHGAGVQTITEPGALLDEMRLFKDEHEIALLREAAAISVAAFEDARRTIRSGAGEWEAEAALEAGFRARGGSGAAFPSIVASAANATVLHYIANNRRMNDGELVLIDAGARYDMYCADISRTYACGDVAADVRALHDLVRSAHDAAIAVARPGGRIGDVHAAAVQTLREGLAGLGLIAPDADEKTQTETLQRYYPHQTSHWLGLDVHDVGDYTDNGRYTDNAGYTDSGGRDHARQATQKQSSGGTGRPLEAGMVFTIEPGLYIPHDDTTAPPALRGVGIRIEDDVLITTAGAEVLTAALPTDP